VVYRVRFYQLLPASNTLLQSISCNCLNNNILLYTSRPKWKRHNIIVLCTRCKLQHMWFYREIICYGKSKCRFQTEYKTLRITLSIHFCVSIFNKNYIIIPNCIIHVIIKDYATNYLEFKRAVHLH